MFEQELIEHCSPTLASIKAASLFTYTYKSLKELHVRVTYWNSKMKRKGITFDILSENVGVNKALIYVYRRADLEKILNRDEIRSFLLNHGYLESKEETIRQAKDKGANVLILGHTHVKELYMDEDLVVLNPGSTSIPKDGSHSVAIIEIMPIEGNHHEVDMDINLIDINTGEIIEL